MPVVSPRNVFTQPRSKASDRRAGRVRGMSAVPLIATELCLAAVRRLVPRAVVSRCSTRTRYSMTSSAHQVPNPLRPHAKKRSRRASPAALELSSTQREFRAKCSEELYPHPKREPVGPRIRHVQVIGGGANGAESRGARTAEEVNC